MRRDGTDHTDELARYLTRRERIPAKMTGATTAGGNSDDTAIWTLPQEIGDVGDVLTVVVNGDGDTVPDWVDPGTITGGGMYLAPAWEIDGSNGWFWVEEDDGTGQMRPVFELHALE
jgi:hypothetical protein